MQRIVKSLKNRLHSARQKLGLVFYTQPQNYKVKYEVEIENIGSVSAEAVLVLPLPLMQAQYVFQQISENIKFNPGGAEVLSEDKFGNKFAVWKLAFAAGEKKSANIEFDIAVLPRKTKLKEEFKISDYNAADSVYSLYMKPSAHLPVGDERFKKMALDVIGKEQNVLRIIQRLNQYVIDFLQYGNQIQGLYSADQALQNKIVDCGGFDSLLAALCVNVGIPARVVSGF